MSDEHASPSGEAGQTDAGDASPAPTRFTLERLSTAFARLMGTTSEPSASGPPIAVDDDGAKPDIAAGRLVTPQMIVEGLLFVGANDGRAASSEQLAAVMRDVDAREVDAIVAQLNAQYDRDGDPCSIVGDSAGYRLQIRLEYDGLRQRVLGRMRAGKLSPAAVEALAIVAYRQGVTSQEVTRLRGVQSYSVLAQLVRRKLLRLERPDDSPRLSRFYTTDRFNALVGVAGPQDLPHIDDLDDS